jgi:hypothetical protein
MPGFVRAVAEEFEAFIERDSGPRFRSGSYRLSIRSMWIVDS